jgi:hypothetical protein
MDFVRAQMTDAERAAEQQYELVQAAVIEGVRRPFDPRLSQPIRSG